MSSQSRSRSSANHNGKDVFTENFVLRTIKRKEKSQAIASVTSLFVGLADFTLDSIDPQRPFFFACGMELDNRGVIASDDMNIDTKADS